MDVYPDPKKKAAEKESRKSDPCVPWFQHVKHVLTIPTWCLRYTTIIHNQYAGGYAKGLEWNNNTSGMYLGIPSDNSKQLWYRLQRLFDDLFTDKNREFPVHAPMVLQRCMG